MAQLGRPLHILFRHFGSAHDRVVIAVELDAETRHGFPGLGDAVHDALRPFCLDPDHDDSRHVRIGARADKRAEMKLQVGAELEPSVGMGDRQRALDVVRNGFARRVRQIVNGQDDDVIAHADATVLTPIAAECGVCVDHFGTS
jgi:hypothetical protein